MAVAIANPASKHRQNAVSLQPHSLVLQIENRSGIESGHREDSRLGETTSGVNCGEKYQQGGWLYIVRRDSLRTGWIRWRSPSNFEHDFAELGAGFEIGVGSGGFGEREHAIDDGLEAAAGDEAHYAVQLGLGAHVGA
jgi:hypothetical protein